MHGRMIETTFEVPKMDCPSEERLIRMALEREGAVRHLRFDLGARRLVVRHERESAPILARLEPLQLGARIVESRTLEEDPAWTGGTAPGKGGLVMTTFDVPKMDCPSEERLIRMALERETGVRDLRFDLGARQLVVHHESESAHILARLEPLGLGARIVESREVQCAPPREPEPDEAAESRVLKQLLAINGGMFVAELGIGLAAQSTGLVADSVDMFADAAVYSVAMYGVGRGLVHKQRAARFSGVLQMLLALGVLVEVGRRAIGGSEPFGALMMGVSLVALAANVSCLALLSKHRTGGIHMKASWIFSTNDVIANIGVIVAGLLVLLTGSAIPDLVVGSVIGIVVFSGALRIFRLATIDEDVA